MANPPQQQQPPPQQPPPTQPPPPSLVVNVISEVASALATSLSPKLAFDKIKPFIKLFGLSSTSMITYRALRSALSEAERFPQPRLAAVGLAQRNMIDTNTTRRAAYVVAATRRLAEEMSAAQSQGEPVEAALSEAVSRENVYFLQHVQADGARMSAASSIDALATRYGDVLGWYARDDQRVSPECLEANGRNFRASESPNIGYPGAVHVSCRCEPGPPHPGAELIPSVGVPTAIAAANFASFDVVEFTQHIADLFEVPVELVKPRQKVPKKSVDYRQAGSDANRRCGSCAMYHASRCDLVLGYISPGDVCDRWEAKPNAVELVSYMDMPDNAVKHVRTPEGVAFFHKPIGSPITETEYKALLAARKAAKSQHPVGHPSRLEAERAVRQARKQRAAAIEQGGHDALSRIQFEVDALAGTKSSASAKPAKSTSTTNPVQSEVNALLGKNTSTSTTNPKAPRVPSPVPTSGQRVNRHGQIDKRQGETGSNFIDPNTGQPMSKSSIGDTYEELFKTHGAHLIEKMLGGDYQQISHLGGGARNTPLDFRLDHTHGGELKTLSSNSRNQKTAIKKEEIARKVAAIGKDGLKPLLVVQVVDQATGEVHVYTHDRFVSKVVATMKHVGTYKYSKKDFESAKNRAGYGGFKGGKPVRESTASPHVREAVARLTDDQEYQKLIDKRLAAKKKFPPGHPERVKAERDVRQFRKKVHGGTSAGSSSTGAKAPTPAPPAPVPKTPTPAPKTPPTRDPGIDEDLHIIGEPKTPVEKHPVAFKSTRVGTGPVKADVQFSHRWSRNDSVNTEFERHASAIISDVMDYQSRFVPELLSGSENKPIHIVVATPSGQDRNALGLYGGSSHYGEMVLHPTVFRHVLHPGIGKVTRSDVAGTVPSPEEILRASHEDGWWVPTDPHWELSHNVASHEFGHGVNDSAFYRSGKDSGIPNDAQFWSDFAKTLGLPAPKAADGLDFHYADTASWIDDNSEVIGKKISKYAADSAENPDYDDEAESGDRAYRDYEKLGKPHEMFAELWTEYTLNSNPRDPAKFYGDYVTKQLKQNSDAVKKQQEEAANFRPEDIGLGRSRDFQYAVVKRTNGNTWILQAKQNGKFVKLGVQLNGADTVKKMLEQMRQSYGGFQHDN